ncbi:MAG: hypothetical protein ACUVQ7_07640 [bacterium]
MKTIILAVITMALLSSGGQVVSVFAWGGYVTGCYVGDPNDPSLTICECPCKHPDQPLKCYCGGRVPEPIAPVSPVDPLPTNPRAGRNLYQQLMTLDSFEGEDGEYLYFSATIREDTDPPIFDFTVAGDAKVKISKKQLQQYLMEEE